MNLFGNLYPSGHMRLSIDLLRKIDYKFKTPVFAEFKFNRTKTKLIMKLKNKRTKTNQSKVGIGFNGIVICSRSTWKTGKMRSHLKYPVIKASKKQVIFDLLKPLKYKGPNSFWRR